MDHDLQLFLQSGPFKAIDGALTALSDFRHLFIDWLDCPVKQNFWSQKRRIEAALRSLGFPIAYRADGGRYGMTQGTFGQLFVGNLGEEARPGGRKYIVEDGHLCHEDYTT